MQAVEKSKEELAAEVVLLRQRVAELEASERERKQVDETLRESEQTKSAVLNATPDLVVVVDDELIIRDVNKSFAKRFGKQPEELIGISGLDLVPPELRKDRERYVQMALQTRQPVRFEDESQGTHFDNILYPILQEQGKVTRIVLNARDITERKQVEEALREKQNLLLEAQHIAHIGNWWHDLVTGEIYWSDEFFRIIGREPQKPTMELVVATIHPDDFHIIQHAMDEAAAGKVEHEHEFRIIRPDGGIRWIHNRWVGIYDEAGKEIKRIGTHQDITERKKAEEEHLANLKFFESMDKVNRAIQSADDIEEMMKNLLDVVISIFDCDRAYLMYPCDPESLTWTCPMERNKPEYPGVMDLKLELPMDPVTAETQRVLLAADGPVIFDLGTSHALPEEVSKQFDIKSFMAVAIYPKTGSPWNFGIHQCAFTRVWTSQEERLFQEIGRRLADGLTSLLVYRDLQESEERFRMVVETMEVGLGAVNENGVYTYVNEYLSKMLGYSMDEMIGRSALDFVYDEEGRKAQGEIFIKRRAGMRDNTPYEVTRRRKDGQKVYSILSPTPSFDADGRYTGSLGIYTDITERKQMEEELRESEEKYRSLVESSKDSIYLVDNKCNYIFLNNKHLSRLDVKSNQAIGKNYSEFHSPDESREFVKKVQTVLKTGQSLSYEYQSQRDNRYFIRTLSPVTSPDREIKAITVISKDITERKQTEEKLKEREAFNYALFRYNPVETIVVDREGKVSAFNMAKEKSGDRMPTIGDRMYKDYAGKHEIDMSAELMKCIKSGKRKEFSERKYGNKYLNITISPFAQGAIIISEDITERKRAEEALRESEQFSSSLLNDSPNPIIVINPDTSIRYVNPALEKLTGFSAAELLGRKAPYPWWGDEIISETTIGLKRAMQQGAQRIENQFQTKSGSQFWVEITSEPVMHDGKVQYLLSNWIDISERKRAEELLQKERDTFYTILEQAPYGVMVLDAAGNHSFLNPEFTSITGYSLEDIPTTQDWLHHAYPNKHYRNMVKKTWEDYYAQSKDEETFRKRFGRAFAMTLNVMCKDGANKEIEFRTSRLGDEATIVMLSDVTDRKRMNDLLETAAAEWRTTFDAISDAVCLLDSHGKIIRCNNAMLKLMEKPFSQITNHHCWEVMHGVSEAPHGCPIELAGKTNHRENEVMFKDSRWFNISVDPLFDEDGNFIGGVHIMSDITDRMLIQNELQDSREQLRNLTVYLQSVREQERTNIAREIHDELAQALTALKMDVSWLDRRLPADAQSLSEKAQSMAKLIDSTIHTVKRISAELRPGILDDLGLVAAIEWQAEEFQNRTGISCNVTVDPQDLTVDQDRSTAIFRIFQETLTNVTRHARATRVTVGLKERAGRLTLRVRDNGTGITEEKITHPQSFGLIGIRERVHPWGGKVSIKGIPGKGTSIQVSVELDRRKNDKEKIESIGSPS